MKPLPNLRSDLNLILGRLPTINRDPALTQAFAMRLIAVSRPESGPRDFDLIDSLRQSVPNLKARWVYRDCTFRAACQTWTVKWPPTELYLDQAGLGVLQGAISDFNAAADEIPWLKDRLNRIRENHLFSSWEADRETPVVDASEPVALVLNTDADDADTDDAARDDAESRADDEEPEDSLTPRQRHLLSKANTSMGRAANNMSLVLVSDNDVLLTGDATKQVMAHALDPGPHHFLVVVTPHHGGKKKYLPDAVTNGSLTSRYWATSVGKRLSSRVDPIYDTLAGPHYRTDQGCCETTTCNLSFIMNHPGVHSNGIAVPHYSSCSTVVPAI